MGTGVMGTSVMGTGVLTNVFHLAGMWTSEVERLMSSNAQSVGRLGAKTLAETIRLIGCVMKKVQDTRFFIFCYEELI